MKRLILQNWNPEETVEIRTQYETEPIIPHSRKSIEKYCLEYNIDYEFVRNKRYFSGSDVTCEKLSVVDEAYNKYDYILILDVDIYVLPRSPNIFDMYSQTDFAVRGAAGSSISWKRHPTSSEIMSIINGGVVLWSRKIIDMVKPEVNRRRSEKIGDEKFIQDLFLWCKQEYNYEWNVSSLDHTFNRYAREFYDLNEPAYFLHYGGDDSKKSKHMFSTHHCQYFDTK